MGRCTRAHRAKVFVCADAEWANAISGRNAASIANVLKRNCKARFDAVSHDAAIAMAAPEFRLHVSPTQGTENPTSWTANLSSK